MKLTTGLITAYFVLSAGIGDATAAVLRPAITVDTDVVRLGDLFADVGEKQDAIVAAAPPPGEKAVFNAIRLQSIARRAGLSWQPQSRHESAVVRRTGRLISADDVRKLIQASLDKSGVPAGYQIALSKHDLTFHVAADDNRELRVAHTRFNPEGKQFSAIVEVPDDGSSYRRLQVTGSVYEVVNVPVLARSIQRGETIRARDLDFVQLRRKAIGRNTIVDSNLIVGKTPRRYLQTGKPIRMADIRPPVLVEKGKLVTLTLKNRHMLITAQGKALEDGAKGEVIRVSNTRSRQTVQGVVVAPNKVAIRLSDITQ